jgi:hypothetical protein
VYGILCPIVKALTALGGLGSTRSSRNRQISWGERGYVVVTPVAVEENRMD